MEKNQIVTPKTKRMIKASYIINLIMFAIIAFMLIPLTVEDGQVYLPSYEKSLLVLLVLAFVAAGFIAFALDRIGKEEKKSASET